MKIYLFIACDINPNKQQLSKNLFWLIARIMVAANQENQIYLMLFSVIVQQRQVYLIIIDKEWLCLLYVQLLAHENIIKYSCMIDRSFFCTHIE